jgi:uncharacterized protein (TIGR02246 family)
VRKWRALRTPSGDLPASVFAEDANFTAIAGLRARARDAIARGHDEIPAAIYRSSQSGCVNDVRFLRPDVAVLDVTMTFVENAPFGLTQSRLGCAATREADGWKIAVFRTMIPFRRLVAGPVEEGLTAAQRRAQPFVRAMLRGMHSGGPRRYQCRVARLAVRNPGVIRRVTRRRE